MKGPNYWIFGEKSGTRTKFNRNTSQLRWFLITLTFFLSDHFPSSSICQMADSNGMGTEEHQLADSLDVTLNSLNVH